MNKSILWLNDSRRAPRSNHVPGAMCSIDTDHWVNVTKDEINSLNSMGTWELVHLSKHRKVVNTKWVFDIKRNGTGQVQKYKARHVPKGFFQIPGIDRQMSFSQLQNTQQFVWCSRFSLCSYENDAKLK